MTTSVCFMCVLCAGTFYNVLKGVQTLSGLDLVDFSGVLSLTKSSISKGRCRYKKQGNEDNKRVDNFYFIQR